MTRKHFVALARKLAWNRPEKKGVRLSQWIKDCKAVADVCNAANMQFDRDRFLLACGLTEKEING